MEKKWSRMKSPARINFAILAKDLALKFPDIKYCAITVRKENVWTHIRRDENKLYNYMIRLLLVGLMAQYESVTFVPDNRTIKVKSGNSLHDYLQTYLWFDLNVKTRLSTCHSDSSSSLNIQFADMLAGIVQSYQEDKALEPWKIINHHIQFKPLYFKTTDKSVIRG